jgi:hypothetical protein
VKSQALHFFFFASAFLAPAEFLLADLSVGRTYSLTLIDMDGHTFHTDDGHVTVVVLTTPAQLEKAETVGDRVPDYCLGNPTFRMITVVKLEEYIPPVRSFVAAMGRRRIESEAKRLQLRYNKRKIGRNARQDLFAVMDFDGKTTSLLGGAPQEPDFQVLVFARSGKLLQKWKEVPTARELAAVVK